MTERGRDHDRPDEAAGVRDLEEGIRAIDQEITQLETGRAALLLGELPDNDREPERRDYSHSSGGDRGDDDRSRGR